MKNVPCLIPRSNKPFLSQQAVLRLGIRLTQLLFLALFVLSLVECPVFGANPSGNPLSRLQSVSSFLSMQLPAREVAARLDGEGNEPTAPASDESSPESGNTGESTTAAPVQSTGTGILQNGWWGPGGYVSPTKLGLYLLLFFLWTYCASWMNSDMERLSNSSRATINLAYVALYCGLGTALLIVPFFLVIFPLTTLMVLIPPIVYVVHRNKPLPPHEKVMTPDHLFFVFATMLRRIGIKVKIKPRVSYQTGPPIELEASGKNIEATVLKGRLILARNAPGYNLFRQQLYDALASQATGVMFDFTPERTAVRHQVDGVWLDLQPVPRVIEKGRNKDVYEEMLESAKLLVGANPADRRSRQGGSFIATIGSGKKAPRYDAEFLSQGTKTGEAAVIQFTSLKVPFETLDSIGMRPDMQTKLLQHLNAREGFVVAAAPPANGLRSSMEVYSRVSDRFTRDVVNVEDAMSPSAEIENIILTQYDSSKGETPATVLPDVFFKEPAVVIIRDTGSLPVLEMCCREVDMHRLFITMIRAKDGVEAILRFLALKIPPQQFLSKLNCVISQRLIRKLCPDCKEPYQPAPQLLQQLGLRPDQVKEFYRTRTPLPEPEEKKRGVCPTCNGVGYRGRTALFELLEIKDSIREAILANPDPAQIRQQFAKEGQTGFLYEGIHLLLKGETTVEEFSRVMKGG